MYPLCSQENYFKVRYSLRRLTCKRKLGGPSVGYELSRQLSGSRGRGLEEFDPGIRQTGVDSMHDDLLIAVWDGGCMRSGSRNYFSVNFRAQSRTSECSLYFIGLNIFV
jgi:hypothetical protein